MIPKLYESLINILSHTFNGKNDSSSCSYVLWIWDHLQMVTPHAYAVYRLTLSARATHQMNLLMSERRGDFSCSRGSMCTDFICCPDLWAGVSAHGAEGGLLFIDVVFMRGRKRSLIEKLCSAPLYHIYSCSWNPPLSFSPTQYLHISLMSSLFPFIPCYMKCDIWGKRGVHI